MDKSELLKYIGNLSQIGGCRHYTLNEGWGRGMRATDINTGSGLQFTVLPDRGLDISLASYKGMNLVYLTCNGETHPSYYEPEGIGWLRTFAGGLFTTCGLTHLGPPSVDDGESLGLHGRYSTVPAKQVSDCSTWVGDEFHIKLKGTAEEGYLFGHKLRLEREISSVLGTNELVISDVITNFGSKISPYTILYHFNFGYPLLSEDTRLVIDPEVTVPRDKNAEPGIDQFREFIEPQQRYDEQVFFHQLKADSEGVASVSLVNKKIGISLKLSFNVNSLPYLTQWKMMGDGEYVLGLEPCNVEVKSRKQLREENTLPFLKPGESVFNTLKLSIEEI